MAIKACVLASGSKGNVVYIETPKHKILVDIGTNLKYISERLKEIDIDPSSINYIFISHTHSDHTSALKNFVKKYQPTVCVSQGLFLELPEIEEYNRILIYEDDFEIDELSISVIKTSHDAPDSKSFVFTYDKKSIVYLTDTGYINNKYFKKLHNKELYIFESNHDIEMLLNGKYPKWLKSRVYGDSGHLSNKAAAFYLAKLVGDNTKKIILHHLSEENNSEEKALETIKETFIEYNIKFIDISCAKPKEKSEVITL